MTGERDRLRTSLLVLVAIKLCAHALFLPLWEGPDEPFHLGKALPIEKVGQSELEEGTPPLQASIAGSVAAHPCSRDLRRVFGCEEFSSSGAFNILAADDAAPWTGPAVPNYEAHQPPVYYLVAAGVLGIAGIENPALALLVVRLLSVALVVIGLVAVYRTDADWFLVLSLFLLLPGAAESLARAANDSLMFLVCVLAMYALTRNRIGLLVGAVAIAPVVKLTAAPFVAAVVVRAWMDGRRKLAVAAAGASLLVLPVQALRGWAWGGTVELNQARIAFDEPLSQSAIGLLRSIYTIAKTTIWLGNWSFFKAPMALLILLGILLVVLLAFSRPTGSRADRCSFLAGLAVFAAGVVAFSIAHRSLFGQWGGVGGWYVWGVMPWVSLGLARTLAIMENRRRPALIGTGLVIIATNLLWLRSALAIYGPA